MQTIIFKGLAEHLHQQVLETQQTLNPQDFKIIVYPDGQHSICLNLDKLNVKQTVQIKCRVRNWVELEILSCLIAALKKNDFNITELHFIYLFGIRSDRAFEVGQPNYLRDVLLPVIESWKLHENTLAWAFHLPSLVHTCLNSSRIFPGLNRDTYILCGDSTAYENIFGAEPSPFIKKRDVNGHLELTKNLESKKFWEYDILHQKDITIFDDLCDGGLSFILQSRLLRENSYKGELNLSITHGLFTKGFDTLFECFDKIYTTNSYRDYESTERFIIQDIWY